MSTLRPCSVDERVMTTTDVIAASKIVVRRGMRPRRIVLRALIRGDVVDEYVVHYEYLQTRDAPAFSCAFVHDGFDQGDYFRVEDSEEAALKLATACFDERASKL